MMVVEERREACEISMGTWWYLYMGIMRTDLFGRAWHLKGAGIIRLPERRHDAPGCLLIAPY